MNVTAVFIIAIIAIAIVNIVKTVSGSKKLNQQFKAHDDALQKEVEALKDRVATLEKIVTDDKYQLNKEFENLK